MDAAAHLDALEQEGGRLLEVAASDLGAAVPTCPRWSVAELLGHVGTVYRWAARSVEERRQEPLTERERLPEGGDAHLWAAEGLERVVEVLGATDPDEPVWGWAGDGRARFWTRRLAHESAVHRVDAELATAPTGHQGDGWPRAVDGDLAVDGIDELLGTLLQSPFYRPKLAGADETIHLHRTDGEGEWLVRLSPEGPVVTHEHAKGDVAARGTASDLLLFLWGRAGTEHLEAFGDAGLLSRWRERFPL